MTKNIFIIVRERETERDTERDRERKRERERESERETGTNRDCHTKGQKDFKKQKKIGR